MCNNHPEERRHPPTEESAPLAIHCSPMIFNPLLHAVGVEVFALDCKASLNKLRIPERSAAAAHGPDLAIDDFLARAVA